MAKHSLKLEITEEFINVDIDGSAFEIMPKLVRLFDMQPKVKELFADALKVQAVYHTNKNKPSQN